MDHDDAYDLIALGAAGALSADEYRALEELLAADPALAAEYRELEEIVSVLADASSESPPPSLRSSVLDAVRIIDQLPPVTAEGTLRDVHDDTPEAVSVDVVTLDAQFSPAPEPETDRGLAPVVPILMSRFAPRRRSSSTTMDSEGVPMPVVWTLTGWPWYVPV